MAKNKFTDEQIQEYKEAFSLFDKDGDNTITTPELLTVMKSLGHNPSRDDVIEMIKDVDSNGNGKIEFSEFLTLMKANMKAFESEELIRGAFEVLDPHAEGYITLQGLRQVVHDLGLDFTDEEMRDMIEEADPTGDGRVNFSGVQTLFVETHIALSEEAKRKWEWRKKRIPLPKFKRTKIVDKVKIKKIPGQKLTKQEARNIDRFNKLSLKVLPEKINVIKRPGLSIKEKHTFQQEIDELLSEEESETEDSEPDESEPEETPRNKKLHVVKKPGLSIREKRKFAPETVDLSKDDGQSSPKAEKVRVIKKQGISLRDKREFEPKETELSADEEQQSSRRDKVRIIKKRGLSIKDKNKLKKERAGYEHENNASDIEVGGKTTKYNRRKSRKEKYIENIVPEGEEKIGEMSQRSLNYQNGDDYGYEDTHDNQNSQNDTYLPPIDTKYGASPQNSPTSSRKMTVHERLYDPDYRKNRSVSKEPEPIYVREFKSRPPKQLEHVKSRHMDATYFEPRGEYVLESEEEPTQQFKSKPPKNLEHVQSRHLSPEYQKKKQSPDGESEEVANTVFVSRPPKKLEHVQSRIKDPKYLQEKPQTAEEETYDNEFKARLPKKLEHVQSKIMDPKYLQEKPPPEEEKYENEFKARLPKKLEHVQSRILEPKKQRPVSEEADTVSLPSFRAKPPKHLQQVGSRILDPSFYEPRPEYVYESEEDNIDHNFKARLPKNLQYVESRALDPKYFKKKVPPIPTEDREALNANHNFKARLPKNLAHVQSRAFDPYYNKSLSPRHEAPVLELRQKGQIVVINVKKNAEARSKSEGYKDRHDSQRAKDGSYSHWRNEFNAAEKIHGTNEFKEDQKPPEKKTKKPWRPPRKPKPEVIDKEFFDSWVMTDTHLYNDSNDMFYRNRKNVSEMWTSLAKSIKKTVIENGERIRPIERTSYY